MKLKYLGEFDNQFDVRYLTGFFTLKNDPSFWIVSYRDIFGPFETETEAQEAANEFEIDYQREDLKESALNLIEQKINNSSFKELILNKEKSNPSVLATIAAFLTIPKTKGNYTSYPPQWAINLAIETDEDRIQQLVLAASLISAEITRLQEEEKLK